MKKLILFLILIPFVGKSQYENGSFPVTTYVEPTETKSTNTVSTKVNVVNKNVELADKNEAIINVLKGELPDLDKVKGFAVADARCGNCEFDPFNETGMAIKKQIRKALEITPFDYDKKWKPKKGYKDGWIYITVVKDIPDNNNVEYTWNFRDKSKRTIYSVQSINKEVSQVLAELGISTY
tara:strand:- start:1726 stop:2268 length:543 start_codon:yes stop_codon:yes gene_type:complete